MESSKVAMKTLAEELAIEEMEQKNQYRLWMLGLEINCKDGSRVWAEVKALTLRKENIGR